MVSPSCSIPPPHQPLPAFEQSNSSITYGEQVIVKLYRRLEVGQNIEVDMNRYLGSEAGFPSVPKLISAATYRGEAGGIPLMLVQQHVGEHRDAWTALTELLRLRHGVTGIRRTARSRHWGNARCPGGGSRVIGAGARADRAGRTSMPGATAFLRSAKKPIGSPASGCVSCPRAPEEVGQRIPRKPA